VWESVIGKNPSRIPGSRRPVESISWTQAEAFVSTLKLRLPSEAEWEYAYRAGTTTRFNYGDDLEAAQMGLHAWFAGNSGKEPHEVATLRPNPWGLFDVAGNVYEWCADTWHDTYEGRPTDGSAWGDSDDGRSVLRGGDYGSNPHDLRAAKRGWNPRGGAWPHQGLRPACSLP
jgi:formylglycine-generating enzyme required for sulfatase activity